ncbi:hypothetical protein [Paenibacillus sp. USHLN196]|uniref:hypothetical protein n=1 Tax=Paenibacillus sp. USHLN196 TaxID=3081291 RepID=UPI003016DD57
MAKIRYFKSELAGELVELFESSHPARAIADIADKKHAQRDLIITQIPEKVYKELQQSEAVGK